MIRTKHVVHIPPSSEGWSGEDVLTGSEEFGNPKDDTKAWGVKFGGDDDTFGLLKI